MRYRILAINLLFAFFLHAGMASAAEPVNHELQVTIDPAANRLSAIDRITLPEGRPDVLTFRLHAGLELSADPGLSIEKLGEEHHFAVYGVRLPAGRHRLTISYYGRIYHELSESDPAYARGIPQTAGQISETGVYLDGGSFWYPDFDATFLTFDLHVELPDGWRSVSQGSRRGQSGPVVTWSTDKPQEQIFLVAGRFTEYTRKNGRVTAMVFLREPDPELAGRYVSATGQYITMYDELIGPYPYAKFALVENFWETGFGMPSFTLMGPRVIRFPFILYSSYPHEILHNWWGNSVYPVYRAGNWAEGLTAYLSDHLLKAQRGEAADYRQTVLQKYMDYVSRGKDLPLTGFTSRHNPQTEAVGYGKGMMFFHMLRRELGDDTFTEALQAFYRRYRFEYAAYGDLRQTFEAVSGRSLVSEFKQWVDRTGAPALRIRDAAVQENNDRYVVTASLEQVQKGPPYALEIPAAVTLEGEKIAREVEIPMDHRKKKIRLTFEKRPLRLDIDPQYDLFRKLARMEIPPALSQIYGAEALVVILPSDAPEEMQAGYRRFARDLGQAGPAQVDIVFDEDLKKLPAEASLVLLGWDNHFRDALSGELEAYDSQVTSTNLSLPGLSVDRVGNTVVVTTRHPADPDHAIAWIASDEPAALPGLARKLPHYHKYSYLAFIGEEPENIARERWPVRRSPMTVFFGEERPEMGQLSKRPPLIELPPDFLH